MAGILQPYQGMHQFLLMVTEWWEGFADAYTEYGPGAADVTGLAGQWADLYRKIMKLKRGMWDREGFDYLTRESAEEILKDLIGHAFLAWDQYNRSIEQSLTSAGSPIDLNRIKTTAHGGSSDSSVPS